VALVDEDGSARGEKHFLIYNPPVIDKDLGLRRSSLIESVRLAEDLHDYQVQTILFGRTRRSVEVMLKYLRERTTGRDWNALADEGPASPKVRGYRSGYLPRQRREIERGLRDGEVRTVVATTALELGIDIGGMDASVLAGYPGTIAGTWQQAGRAGRGQESSLTMMVMSASPLDQFLAKHPAYFFERTPEQGLINPDNLLILLGHLRCASFELPFQDGEGFGRLPAEQVQEFLDFLVDEGLLHHSGERYFWMADKYPAEGVSLRSASADAVVLQAHTPEGVSTVGKVDVPSACWMVHPGAVYMHEARTFLVESLDLDQKIAVLKPAELDYYTEDRSQKTVNLVEKLGETPAAGCLEAYGEIQVVTQVVGYRKVRWHTNETLGFGEVSLPPQELLTTGYWFGLAEATVQRLQDEGLWRNSPNDYGPRWTQIRDRVRARDGYRCQVCGTPEMGRSHDVHHKAPFRSFTSVEEANQLTNLITLCPNCHHQVELNVRIRSGLAGLSFVLLNLAPLFLMCDARDLGFHSDPQLSLVDGKPGVVIYDQAQGGIGFSEKLFSMHADLMQQARELIAGCECADGCPSCVGPGGENGLGGKKETLGLVEALSEA
jgi:DEAD/DEAH box helicase domain-containing protein